MIPLGCENLFSLSLATGVCQYGVLYYISSFYSLYIVIKVLYLCFKNEYNRLSQESKGALTGVAQGTERRPANQRVAGSISSEGT